MANDFPLNRKLERMPEQYAPYLGHISDGVVLLRQRQHMAIVRLTAAPFELLSPRIRKNRALTLNDLLRRLQVDQIGIHLVKHRARRSRTPIFDTAYATHLMQRYEQAALGEQVWAISWFVSLIVRPQGGGRWWRRNAPVTADHEAVLQLEHAVSILSGTLSENHPVRLGRVDVPTDMPEETVTLSEIGAALFLIRTGIERDIPETSGPLGAAVLSSTPYFGRRAFDLNVPGEQRVGAMISLKDYPARTRPGQLNELLAADFSFSLTQTMSFENNRMRELSLAFKDIHLSNTGKGNADLSAGLTRLANDRSTNRTTSGMHNLAMAVFACDEPALNRHTGEAIAAMTRFGGANPVVERNVWYNGAMEAQYWALLPGVDWTHCRSGQITTENLAHLASLEGYPAGKQSGYWGRPVIRFLTRARTYYDYIPTVDDVAHTMITGMTGSGKTVLISTLKTAMQPVLGPTGIRLLIDKDGSNRISIEMEGGTYATFRRGIESGAAPLRALDDTPRNRAFLHGLYTWLIMRDGRGTISNDEDHRLQRGIALQMRMPKHLRSMGGVREMLGYADRLNGAGARFERWCAGRSMGWLLDGQSHVIQFDPTGGLYGFDFSALIPKEGDVDDGSCQAIAAVISHQMSDLLDGRRIMCIFEECRFYLEPLAKLIDDYTLTGRKNELMVVLVAQQPEHFLNSSIGLSLISQCRTKIMFPNKDAHKASYTEIGVSEAAYEQLAHGMFVGAAGRRFLLWRGADDCAICEFDLSKMDAEVAIMSARAGTSRILDRLKSEAVRLAPEELRTRFLIEHAAAEQAKQREAA